MYSSVAGICKREKQSLHKILKYCHGFFGSIALLCLQGLQYNMGGTKSPRGPEWAGQAFHPASASLFKAIGDQCIV